MRPISLLRAVVPAVVAAALLGAAPAAPAAAATNDVTGGSTVLSIPAATTTALRHAGVRSIRAAAPATGVTTAQGQRLTFPVSGGGVDLVPFIGTVTHSGSLTITSTSGRSVRVGSFVFDLTNSQLDATVQGTTTSLPLLDLRDLEISTDGSTTATFAYASSGLTADALALLARYGVCTARLAPLDFGAATVTLALGAAA